MIAREALARWPSLWQSLVHLYSIPVGSSALVSLLPGGACSIGRVHWYRHVVHPWWGVGQSHLLWREALRRLGIPWLEALLVIVVTEALEIRCILRDPVNQLH